jgi:hypothetical protein
MKSAALLPAAFLLSFAVGCASTGDTPAPVAAAPDIVDTVVPGKVMAADVMRMSDGTVVKTAGGTEINVGVSAAGVTVNKAAVTKTDIQAKNGVIHVIDSVILPST